MCVCLFFFFFQAEDGIRDLVRSRGLGDVYKRQGLFLEEGPRRPQLQSKSGVEHVRRRESIVDVLGACLLYTSDAADDLLCVDLGGRRIIKKKKE